MDQMMESVLSSQSFAKTSVPKTLFTMTFQTSSIETSAAPIPMAVKHETTRMTAVMTQKTMKCNFF